MRLGRYFQLCYVLLRFVQFYVLLGFFFLAVSKCSQFRDGDETKSNCEWTADGSSLSQEVKILTGVDIENQLRQSNKDLVVRFHTDTLCGSGPGHGTVEGCQGLACAFERTAKLIMNEVNEAGGRQEVVFGSVDLSQPENKPIAKRYRVRAPPEVWAFPAAAAAATQGGGRGRAAAAPPGEDLAAFVRRALGLRSPDPWGQPDAMPLASSKAEAVERLTAESFGPAINKHPSVVVVKFFAPWCGHSRRLAADFEGAAVAVAGGGRGPKFAELDCTAPGADALCRGRYGITSYPVVKAFLGNIYHHISFGGDRTAEELSAFARRQATVMAAHHQSREDL